MKALALSCLVLLGCPSTSALDAYRAESLACVSQAKTRPEADACRMLVVAKYCSGGGALSDAGACAADGGTP